MKTENLPQTALSEDELFNVLSSSLYVGAQEESIKLVLGYCQAAGLDPMQKPVHIVPMYCATGKKDANGYDVKAMRDVVMPGIGLYRIQAARTGNYAGATEPEYGDDVTEMLDNVKVTYPKWCKVTVKRQLANGDIAEFTSIEFWKENYATKSKSTAPNAMWLKRPYGQIAKCAEAQALRKAFPEIGSQPTADEMEGKELDVTPPPAKKETRQIVEFCSDQKFIENSKKWEEIVSSGKKSADDLIAFIRTKAELTETQKEEIKSWEVGNADA